MPNQSLAAKMRTFLGCLAGVVGFFAAGLLLLVWVMQTGRYEDTYGRNNVTSPDGKHKALIRSGEEYFHDSVMLDDKTVAVSRTFWLLDLRWKDSQTLVVRFLPSSLPNKTNGPVQFDEQAHNVGDVRIEYVLTSKGTVDKEMHEEEENRKRWQRMKKKPVL